MAKHAEATQQGSSEPGAGAGGTPPEGTAGPARPRRRGPSPLQIGLTVVLVAALAFAVTAATHRSSGGNGPVVTSLRPTGIPSSVSTSTATLMALSPIKKAQAPGFHLIDQNGKPVSLAAERGKVVVLEFMDPHCTDICPIVSKEFVDASRDLGRLNAKTVFMAINVNQFYARPANLAAFSKAHGLDSIPSWRFVTGTLPQLKKAWHDYGISVEAPHPNGDIIHTSAVFFIDRNGVERYLAMPQVDHTKSGKAFLPAAQVATWGKGIAKVVRSLAG